MRARLGSLVLVLLLAAACATGRDAVLTRTLAGLDAASKAFATADADHQTAIVAGAASRADADAQLASYRAQRAKVTAAFATAYAALALASITPDEPSVDAAVSATFAAAAAVKEVLR